MDNQQNCRTNNSPSLSSVQVLSAKQHMAKGRLDKQLEIDQTIREEKAYLQAQHWQEQKEIEQKQQDIEKARIEQEKLDREEAKKQVKLAEERAVRAMEEEWKRLQEVMKADRVRKVEELRLQQERAEKLYVSGVCAGFFFIHFYAVSVLFNASVVHVKGVM